MLLRANTYLIPERLRQNRTEVGGKFTDVSAPVQHRGVTPTSAIGSVTFVHILSNGWALKTSKTQRRFSEDIRQFVLHERHRNEYEGGSIGRK